MEEKYRHRKGTPRRSGETPDIEPESQNFTVQKNTSEEYPDQANGMRSRNSGQSNKYSGGGYGSSRYDEVQPRNNASRQEFEQQQSRYPRRYESQPRNYGAPAPRSYGYGQQQRGGYEPNPRRYESGPPRYDRPVRRDNGGAPRFNDRGNAPFKPFKKQGKQEDLPKKVKLKSTPLIKALYQMRYASRNIALEAIRDGVVEINGIPVTKQNAPVYEKDAITVNGHPVQNNGTMYLAFNKPRKLNGSAEQGEPGIQSILDAKNGWYFPVGCLNRAASGIVVVTNDPAHKTQETSSIAGVVKEYHVKLHRKPKEKEIELLKREFAALESESFAVTDVTLLRATARHAWISLIATKGNLTQIRKVIKSAGFEILAFERYRVGGFTADELKEGSWKRLSADEINLLQSSEAAPVVAGEDDKDDKKPKWQQLYSQWFKST